MATFTGINNRGLSPQIRGAVDNVEAIAVEVDDVLSDPSRVGVESIGRDLIARVIQAGKVLAKVHPLNGVDKEAVEKLRNSLFSLDGQLRKNFIFHPPHWDQRALFNRAFFALCWSFPENSFLGKATRQYLGDWDPAQSVEENTHRAQRFLRGVRTLLCKAWPLLAHEQQKELVCQRIEIVDRRSYLVKKLSTLAGINEIGEAIRERRAKILIRFFGWAATYSDTIKQVKENLDHRNDLSLLEEAQEIRTWLKENGPRVEDFHRPLRGELFPYRHFRGDRGELFPYEDSVICSPDTYPPEAICLPQIEWQLHTNALETSCETGHLETVMALLSAWEFDLDIKNRALEAAAGGRFFVIEALVENDARLEGSAHLTRAAGFGHLKSAKWMIEANASGEKQDLALQEAAYGGHFLVVKELLERGRTNPVGRDVALERVVEECFDPRIVKILLEKGRTTSRAQENALLLARLELRQQKNVGIQSRLNEIIRLLRDHLGFEITEEKEP